jgi:UDP-N-acetylmuramoyl-L-alanyl-D-glutamate--2,6-diaminopimelate ligase
MKLCELLSPWAISAVVDCEITGLQNDSRKIQPGDLFVAYPGAVTDGRLFIEQACGLGASAIVYDPEGPSSLVIPSCSIPCVPVPQLAMKLAAIASRFYEAPTKHLSVIGVTGTNGKTTIAYQLAQAYDMLNRPAVYIGTLGQGPVQNLQPLSNTTPDALYLQQMFYEHKKMGIRHACIEVSSHALHQHRVDHIDFSGAIYTNLSHDHLDYHHTMSDYAEAKSALFAMPSLKWAVINQDDAYSPLMVKKLNASCQAITYGLQDICDVRAIGWNVSMTCSQLDIVSPWGRHDIQVNLLGKFNVYNTLAVFSSLLADGVPLAEVMAVMGKLQAAPGRMEVVSKKPCVIVDYAHTPDALDNVLSTLTQLKQGRLGVVFGCGGDRDKSKRPIMGRIASQWADFVIVTSDNPRSEDPTRIIDDIAAGLLPTNQVEQVVDRAQAIHRALQMTGENDILLIAGKGHEAYQQIGNERFSFSDQDVVRVWLNL